MWGWRLGVGTFWTPPVCNNCLPTPHTQMRSVSQRTEAVFRANRRERKCGERGCKYERELWVLFGHDTLHQLLWETAFPAPPSPPQICTSSCLLVKHCWNWTATVWNYQGTAFLTCCPFYDFADLYIGFRRPDSGLVTLVTVVHGSPWTGFCSPRCFH